MPADKPRWGGPRKPRPGKEIGRPPKPPDERTERVAYRFPAGLAQRVRARADEEGIPATALIVEGIEMRLRRPLRRKK